MDVLKQRLVENDVNCTSKLFKTVDGIGGISGQIFVSTVKVFYYSIVINCVGCLFIYRRKTPEYTFWRCMQVMLETSFVGYMHCDESIKVSEYFEYHTGIR